MAAIFFIIITPIGFLMRVFNKNLINLKKEDKKSEKKASKKEEKKTPKKEEAEPMVANAVPAEPISESKFIPTDDPFNQTYNFKVIAFDSAKNEAMQSKEAFEASNLYEAYDKFLSILNDKDYDF